MTYRIPIHFSLIVSATILFAIAVVIWAGEKQISDFEDNHVNIINTKVDSATADIERFVSSRRTLVEAFAIDNANRISALSLAPEDEGLIEDMDTRLRRWFPEYFTFTVASPDGTDLIDDIDGFVGGVCKADIKMFAEQLTLGEEKMRDASDHNQQETFIHPQASNYHFDIMAPWTNQGLLRGVFFVSFYPTSIQRILNNYQTDSHNLVVLHRDRQGLIEVTPSGTREDFAGTRDIELTSQELKLVTHRRSIDGTKWIVAGYPTSGLFAGQAENTRTTAYSIVLLLFILWVGALFFAARQERDRQFAVASEKKAMKNLEATIAELTQSKQAIDQQAAELEKHLRDSDFNREKLEEQSQEQVALLEELAIARDKAESANKAKSSFLSTMSHEIRTPLNGVLGLAQLLMDSRLNADQQKKVETILSSGQTLLAIINDVLDMSKIEAGGIELEEKAFSMWDVVSTIATPFQSLADNKGVELEVSRAIPSDMVVKGDPVRLRQILWNLLSNAIKFTDEGRVSLKVSDHLDETLSPGDRHFLRFSVEDTGAGIAADRLDAIFDAFTQEDSTITRKHGGTGLGLSIVRELTELMGGRIRAESELGEGTTFTVDLPFSIASQEETDAIHLQNHRVDTDHSSPLNVIVAEDNEVNALIATAFLEKLGHSVRHVENGLQAVDAARGNWPDLIFMDIHMPEMNGLDATREIRSTEEGRRIPIIGLTAEAFADRHAEFRNAGMSDVLTKPFTEQQMENTLAANRLIDRRTGDREKNRSSAATETTVDAPLSPVGDDSKLTELRAQLPAEVIDNLLEQAQGSLRTRIQELEQGVRAEDSTQIREAAHAIKGVCASMCATRVSEMAAHIEEHAQDVEEAQSSVDGLKEAADETIKWWQGQTD